MGATFSRLKNWTTEVLTYADLNAEIDNILNNLGPAGVDDYSSNAAQMKLTTAPGSTGSESLATSLAGELERIRYVLKDMKGSNATNWYDTANTTLSDLLTATGGSLAANRIASGKVSANSGASRFLVPAGTAANLTVSATSTAALTYYINSVAYSITASVTVNLSAYLTSGGASDMAGVSDATLSAQELSQWQGEDGSVLNISAVGSNISNLVGNYAAFSIAHGGNTEYFIGYVNSATQITNCYRGCFLNNAQSPISRIPIANGDPVNLMKLTWLFANTASTVVPSALMPQVSYATPSSTQSYWFDMSTNLWKTYNGSGWTASGATLIGISAQDTTACQAARSFMYAANFDAQSNMVLDYVSATNIISRNAGSKIGVGASILNFNATKPAWDITLNLESGYAESASTTYWAYVGESGQIKLSPVKPYFGFDQARGWYHPYENWRAVGRIFNDGSSNFDQHQLFTYQADPNSKGVNANFDFDTWDMRNVGISSSINGSALVVTLNGADGTELSPGNPAYVNFRHTAAATGVQVLRKITSNISATIPVAATLGHFGAQAQYVWTYVLNGPSALDLGFIGVQPVSDYSIYSPIALSSTATSGSLLFSGGVVTGANIPIRLCARLTSNQTNAGTWTVTPSNITIKPQLIYNITDWAQSTNVSPSTAAWGVLGNASYFERRVGDMVFFRGFFTNATNNAVAASFGVGYTCDSNKLVALARNVVGEYWILDPSSANHAYLPVSTFTAAYTGVIAMNPSSASSVILSMYANVTQATAGLVNNGHYGSTNSGWMFEFGYPVAGWSAYGP